MIDTSTCNASHLEGCSTQSPPTVPVGIGPISVAVNASTHSVYVGNDDVENDNNNDGDTLSVFDASTCNATTQAGCARQGTLTVGTGPYSIAFDTATNTVYSADLVSQTVSVTNGQDCDAADLAGCATAPEASVAVGVDAVWAEMDNVDHTLYVVNASDDTVSVIDTGICNGRHLAACAGLIPASLQTGNGPNAAAFDPATHTLYVPNWVDNDVSVIDTTQCNATDTTGCRHPAPTVPDNEFLATVDPATNTIYAGNNELPEIDVLNGATCNVEDLSGCAPVAEIPTAVAEANLGAVDDFTHTLYASDPVAGTVSVINTASCNAQHIKGCSTVAPTITIGPDSGPPVLDPVTHTLYVPYGSEANEVAVVNAAILQRGGHPRLRAQTPASVTVDPLNFVLGLSIRTDTIYAPSLADNTVAVINGATCNGTDHSGCGSLAATVNVGANPFGVAVDDLTHTVYVTNNANGDSPGTLSMINGATCNGSEHRRMRRSGTDGRGRPSTVPRHGEHRYGCRVRDRCGGRDGIGIGRIDM